MVFANERRMREACIDHIGLESGMCGFHVDQDYLYIDTILEVPFIRLAQTTTFRSN
jgi:hypothetical protein